MDSRGASLALYASSYTLDLGNGCRRVGDISLAKTCAKVIKKNWDADFSDCYTGKQGKALLKESGESGYTFTCTRKPMHSFRSPVQLAHQKNITRSCTVIVNEKQVCIRDGVWKDCPIGHEAADFEKYIEQEYKAINSRSQHVP